MRADIHDGQGAKHSLQTGRIQMREINHLQIVTSGLHRTAGPYKVHGQAAWAAKSGMAHVSV
jgi:hypothetical protein